MGRPSGSDSGERLARARALIDEDDFKGARKELLDIMKDIPDDGAHAASRIEADLLMSEALKATAEFGTALEHAERAIGAARDIDDPRLLAVALRQHGHILIRTSEYERAREQVAKSLEISRGLGDRGLEALARMELANILYLRGDPRKAEAEVREAVLMLEEVGDRRSVARAYNNLATYVHARGDKERALEFFERTKAMSKRAGASRYMGLAMMNKAGVLIELRRLDEARAEADAAVRIFEEAGDRLLLADTYMVYGLIHAEKGEWDEAEDMLQRARLLAKRIGMPAAAGAMLFEIGKVYVLKGERDRGLRHIREAREVFEGHGSVNALRVLDDYLRTLGDG